MLLQNVGLLCGRAMRPHTLPLCLCSVGHHNARNALQGFASCCHVRRPTDTLCCEPTLMSNDSLAVLQNNAMMTSP